MCMYYHARRFLARSDCHAFSYRFDTRLPTLCSIVFFRVPLYFRPHDAFSSSSQHSTSSVVSPWSFWSLNHSRCPSYMCPSLIASLRVIVHNHRSILISFTSSRFFLWLRCSPCFFPMNLRPMQYRWSDHCFMVTMSDVLIFSYAAYINRI